MAKVYVKRIKTGETVDEIDVGDPPHIQFDLFLRGLLTNMDREEYYVDTHEVEWRR